MRSTRWPRYSRRPRLRGALVTLVLIAGLAVIVGLLAPPPPTLSGRAIALDGDTIRVGETRVRLVGLDAVEIDQTCTEGGLEWKCGREAHQFLTGLVQRGEMRCTVEGRDQYRRMLGRCKATGTPDIGESIVRAGWAVTDLDYAAALVEARAKRRGIWSGDFIDPREWRDQKGGGAPSLLDWLMSLFGH